MSGASLSVVLGLLLAPAGANARAIPIRGFEASSLHGPVRLQTVASAPDGAAVEITPHATAFRQVRLLASKRVDLTVKVDCPLHVRLEITIDHRQPVRLEPRSTGWESLSSAVGIRAGLHLIRIAERVGATSRGRCSGADVDRLDFIPSDKRNEVLLGAAMRAQSLATDAQYRATFLANFDSLTPENELKMLFVEPEPGMYDFAPADALVDFAASNGKAVRGHTLVYGSQLPTWVTAPLIPWTPASLVAVMRNYISTVMHRYAAQIDTWDVVNEAFNDDGSYRQNIWYDVIGPSYIEDAFRFAREADPTAKLFYNDLGAELPSPKAAAILAMVRDFQGRGVPIDGIGLQDHTDVPGYPPRDQLKGMISRFGALGLGVEITEMDVGLSTAQGTLAEREEQQAAAYRADATACWDIAACHRLTTWGLYDGLTWLGSDQTPLLFDTAYRPKPAFFAVQSALHR